MHAPFPRFVSGLGRKDVASRGGSPWSPLLGFLCLTRRSLAMPCIHYSIARVTLALSSEIQWWPWKRCTRSLLTLYTRCQLSLLCLAWPLFVCLFVFFPLICHHEKLSFFNFCPQSELQLCSGSPSQGIAPLPNLLTFPGIRQSGERRKLWCFELCFNHQLGPDRHHWKHWYYRFIDRRVSARNLLGVQIPL